MRMESGPSGRVRGFTLLATMLAAIVVGLAALFLVGGFFAAVSDDGRITYSAESGT
jgi:type II secretory pathway pseudopilin PulG